LARRKILRKHVYGNSSKKINAGCLKIFKFLMLLYQDNATYEKVMDIFKDEIRYENTSNNIQVILNKYINTLKIFGVKIIKEKGKYRLLSTLYTVDMTLEDLKALSILHASIENFPDTRLSNNIDKLVNIMEARMNNDDRQTLNFLTSNSNYDFSFYYTDWREQIKQCIELCRQNVLLKITYFDKGNKVQIKCSAKEVVYDSKSALLSVFAVNERQNLNIPVPNIISIDRYPTLTNKVEMTQTVVFKLSGRLAQTYHIREDYEREISHGQDYRVYANTGEPFDSLLSRLMRYQNSCEILSPKSFREKMLALINGALENYNEENSNTPDEKSASLKGKKSKKLTHKDIIE